MLAMFGLTPGVYKDVIDVDENELMEKLPEYLVQKILEYGGGVGKSIRHDPIFIVAGRCYKGSFPLVPLTYPDEVVGAAEVQLSEDTSSAELLQCRWDEGKRIPELNRDLIQCPIVDTRPQTTVLLGHEEEARSSRGCRRTDVLLF